MTCQIIDHFVGNAKPYLVKIDLSVKKMLSQHYYYWYHSLCMLWLNIDLNNYQDYVWAHNSYISNIIKSVNVKQRTGIDYFYNSSQLFNALVTIVMNWIKFNKKDETCHLRKSSIMFIQKVCGKWWIGRK